MSNTVYRAQTYSMKGKDVPAINSEILPGYIFALESRKSGNDYVGVYTLSSKGHSLIFAATSYGLFLDELVQRFGTIACEKANLITVKESYD